jgi:hypothetical protein
MQSVPKNKILADIQCQLDILEFLKAGGTIVSRKTRAKRKPTTFRNNKYSIFNMGHQASITGKYKFKAIA